MKTAKRHICPTTGLSGDFRVTTAICRVTAMHGPCAAMRGAHSATVFDFQQGKIGVLQKMGGFGQ